MNNNSFVDLDESLPNDSEEARLREEYDQLSKKLTKQKLILSVMKDIDVNDIKSVDEDGKKNIDRALDFVRAFDYMKMDNMGTNVLGLPDKPQELSYVERRALKSKLLEELPKHYEKQLEFCKKMEPEVINPEILDKQLMDVKAREKELLTELAAKKVELITGLKECVELRYGPHQKNVSILDKALFGVEEAKAQVVKVILEENISSMDESVNHAIAKIESKLDKAIAEKEIEQAGKSDSNKL